MKATFIATENRFDEKERLAYGFSCWEDLVRDLPWAFPNEPIPLSNARKVVDSSVWSICSTASNQIGKEPLLLDEIKNLRREFAGLPNRVLPIVSVSSALLLMRMHNRENIRSLLAVERTRLRKRYRDLGFLESENKRRLDCIDAVWEHRAGSGRKSMFGIDLFLVPLIVASETVGMSRQKLSSLLSRTLYFDRRKNKGIVETARAQLNRLEPEVEFYRPYLKLPPFIYSALFQKTH